MVWEIILNICLWCRSSVVPGQYSQVSVSTDCEMVRLFACGSLCVLAVLLEVSPQADEFSAGMNFKMTGIMSVICGFWRLCGLTEELQLLIVLDLLHRCGGLCPSWCLPFSDVSQAVWCLQPGGLSADRANSCVSLLPNLLSAENILTITGLWQKILCYVGL